MQVSCLVLLLLGLSAPILAYPGGRVVSDEIDFVPLENHQKPGFVEGPFDGPFDGLFEGLGGLVSRMRSQMDQLLRNFQFGNGSINQSSLFPSIQDLDLSKGNSTSVTKVINGHKVMINETEYKREGESGGAFFKVRIIDVLPDSGELTTEPDAEQLSPTPKDVEAVEDSQENEIHKQHEEALTRPDQWASLESFEDNSLGADLSQDTHVNQLLADQQAPHNPDAEVFDPDVFQYTADI